MSREQSYLTMLEATATMQEHISVILQAKAMEAGKIKCWLCNHLSDDAYTEKEAQIKQSIEIHEKMIEVIDGLTKLENGFSNHLKIVLGDNSDEDDQAMGLGDSGIGDFFGQSEDDS